MYLLTTDKFPQDNSYFRVSFPYDSFDCPIFHFFQNFRMATSNWSNATFVFFNYSR